MDSRTSHCKLEIKSMSNSVFRRSRSRARSMIGLELSWIYRGTDYFMEPERANGDD